VQRNRWHWIHDVVVRRRHVADTSPRALSDTTCFVSR
jgi:hypothetical protein